jgi:hypothetical protein
LSSIPIQRQADTSPARKARPRFACRSQAEVEVQWDNYARLEPGKYPSYCRTARWYRDPQFQRWTCLLRFDVLSTDLLRTLATVPFWMNGGNRERPRAGRRSMYFSEWIRAASRAPTRADRLTPRIFIRRFASVMIRDTKGLAPYSVIDKILSWDTGLPASQSVNKSHSQGRHGLTAS